MRLSKQKVDRKSLASVQDYRRLSSRRGPIRKGQPGRTGIAQRKMLVYTVC